MLIRVGHRNVLIVEPLKSRLSMFYLSMFYLSVYHIIPSMIFLSKLLKLLFVVVFSHICM